MGVNPVALNPPTAGLRPLFNRSKQPAKVSIVIAPGEQLAVSDELAEQLIAASPAIADIAASDAPKGAPASELAEEAAAEVAPDAAEVQAPAPKAKTKKA